MLKFTNFVVAVTVVVSPLIKLALASDCAGSVLCCDQFTTASSPNAADLLQHFNIVVLDPNTGVGLNCSPISVIGGGADPWYVYHHLKHHTGNYPLTLSERIVY